MKKKTFYINLFCFTDENKKHVKQIEELKRTLQDQLLETNKNRTPATSDDSTVVKKLKKEIDALNNELDDLIEYKANFERLKLEYDKLSKNHEKILNEKLTQASPRKSSIITAAGSLPAVATTASSNSLASTTSNLKESSQLELEWIKGENTKLTLELEKTEAKLNERIAQCAELKQKIADKDEEMKAFISRQEQKDKTPSSEEEDLLKLQRKLIEIEEELSQERDEHQKELETNEKRYNELLKRNDQLWSQKSTFETKLDEALEVINEQSEHVHVLETKLGEIEQVRALIHPYNHL